MIKPENLKPRRDPRHEIEFISSGSLMIDPVLHAPGSASRDLLPQSSAEGARGGRP